jgi:8-oxo-dGTP diphosphatase
MPYTPVLGTLCYVIDADRVLMIHREGRPDDLHLGKYNGLGGKVEPDEDVIASVIREVREEAGIVLEEPRLRGTISWPGFGTDGEDWFGFIFVADSWTGELTTHNPEGVLEWMPRARLLSFDLELWPGDRFFLPLVFDETVAQFHGVMPYRDGQPESWQVSVVEAAPKVRVPRGVADPEAG